MTELFGRLAPGADVEAVRAELRAVHGAIMNEHPEAYPRDADFGIEAVRLRDQITSPARTVLLVLLAASALIFIIACSNVANLILARSVRREGELAIRAALGASAGALRRTLLAESLLLCGAGAVLGVAIAWPMVAILGRYAARFSVRALDLNVDVSVLWVGVVLALVAAVILAFVPRLPRRERGERTGPVERQRPDHVGHESPAAAVRGDADSRLVRAARGRRHAADDAVRAAGGAHRLQHPERAGAARADRVLLASARADRRVLQGSAAAHRRRCRACERVAVGTIVPWRDAGSFGPGFQFSVEGYAKANGEEDPRARFRTVSPGFFAALGVPIVAGRDFNDARPARRREGRHRQPEPRPAHVPEAGRAQPPPDVDRSGDEVHRRQHAASGASSASRPTWTTRTSCRVRP